MTDGSTLGNLFADLAASAAEEGLVTLLAAPGLRIERIVSMGQASPPGFWYDQDDAEWVVVLEGAARLSIAGEDAPRLLCRGDFVHLPAHTRHRVEWTDPAIATVWLAVTYRPRRSDA
jgi:cupin 2 domain-containing protein